MLPRLLVPAIALVIACGGPALGLRGTAVQAIDAPARGASPAVVTAPRVRFAGVSSIRPPRGSVHLRFQVENLAAAPVPYEGYLPQPVDRPNPEYTIHPLYSLQYERKGSWKPHRLGWCGTGTGPVRLEPQSKDTFLATVPLDDWKALKVGITWYASDDRMNPQVAWSDVVPWKRVAPRVPARSAGHT